MGPVTASDKNVRGEDETIAFLRPQEITFIMRLVRYITLSGRHENYATKGVTIPKASTTNNRIHSKKQRELERAIVLRNRNCVSSRKGTKRTAANQAELSRKSQLLKECSPQRLVREASGSTRRLRCKRCKPDRGHPMILEERNVWGQFN